MYRFFLIFIDMIPSVIYLLPLFLIIFRKQEKKRRWQIILFASYLSAIFSAVGVPYLFLFFHPSFPWDPNLNLVPFLDMAHDPGPFLKNFFLNILLFVPWGFFLPLLWKEQTATLQKSLCYGLGFSCFIELMQLFTFRMTDIDDLIANTIGAILGFLFYQYFCSKKQQQETMATEAENKTNTVAIATPVAYQEMTVIFLLTLAVYMTLQPITSRFIWDLLL